MRKKLIALAIMLGIGFSMISAPASVKANDDNSTEAVIESMQQGEYSNEIIFKGYYDVRFLTVSYNSNDLKLTAVSNGNSSHSYLNNTLYLTFSYYNADNTLRFQKTILGKETANDLANELNNTVVNPGDYIKVDHREQGSRLAITGAVENINVDMSLNVGSQNIRSGYLYLGGSKLEFTTNLKSQSKAELGSVIDSAKATANENYKPLTWNTLQKAIKDGEAIIGRAYVTDNEIKVAKENINAAINKLEKNNVFHILAYNSTEVLTLEIDYEKMELKATGRPGFVHGNFGDEEYFRIEIMTSYGRVMDSFVVKGWDSPMQVAEKLNGYYLMNGDFIYIYHKEAGTRLKIDGPIIDAPYDFSKGMYPFTNTYGTDVHFKVDNGNLIYRNNK